LFLLLLPVTAYLAADSIMPAIDGYRSPLRDQPPQPGPAPLPRLTRRVVFVLIDGLRADAAFDPQVMPFLAELRRSGASAEMRSRAPSFSAPAYAVLFTGAWQDLSDGPPSNQYLDDYRAWTQDHLFAAAKRAGMQTGVAGYYWFEKFIPASLRDVFYFTPGEDQAADAEVMRASARWVADPTFKFVLVHLDQVDYAGHNEGGGAGPAYASAAGRVDELLRQVAGHLYLAEDTLLVTSDHGHLDRGGHGGPEAVVTTQPFVLAGAGVRPGQYPEIQMVDVAPTVAALLGLPLPASAQGRAQRGMLALSPDQEQALLQAELQQQQQLAEALRQAGAAFDLPVDPADPVGSLQAQMVDALDPGIGWRIAGTVGLLALVGAAWYRRRSPLLFWGFAAALFYLFLFHQMYAVALGRTYSFSSVKSSGDLILATVLPAVLAYLLALIGLRYAFQYKDWVVPPAAAALELALSVLTLLLLPVLVHAAWNGFTPERFLPEYWTLFFALSALLQMIAVGGLGALATAGLALYPQRPAKSVTSLASSSGR
ncbi:MAG: alkaline phosphatase family protein, partial [Chloroflexota bacterium]